MSASVRGERRSATYTCRKDQADQIARRAKMPRVRDRRSVMLLVGRSDAAPVVSRRMGARRAPLVPTRSREPNRRDDESPERVLARPERTGVPLRCGTPFPDDDLYRARSRYETGKASQSPVVCRARCLRGERDSTMSTVRCAPMEVQLDAVDYADAMLFMRCASESVDVATAPRSVAGSWSPKFAYAKELVTITPPGAPNSDQLHQRRGARSTRRATPVSRTRRRAARAYDVADTAERHSPRGS